MPRTPKIPAYRLHKASGQAIVTLQARDFYLGLHGSPESRQLYDRLIAEYLARGRLAPEPLRPSSASSNCQQRVADLAQAYLRHCRDVYQHSDEAIGVEYSLRPLLDLYADLPADEFGPLKLKAVRAKMVESGRLSRKEINKRVGRIKRMFAWATEEELVPPSTRHALSCVQALKFGRSTARESEPVAPVSEEHVRAIFPYVTPQVRAMIELQWFTAMRPGEVIQMRTNDIDRSGETWMYVPRQHKTAYRGQRRTIVIGENSQKIVAQWLRPDGDECLFQPREAVEWQRQQRQAARKTPLSCGNRPGTNKVRTPRRVARVQYSVNSYGRAIARACVKAGIPSWHPHQLRHTAATRIRKKYGLDVARILLGHRSPQITETYARIDTDRAVEVGRHAC